jgi:peptide/nickel transport system permease protein
LILAVAGPLLAPFPADRTDILAAAQDPNAEHLLGTDALGRDIFSRLLVGARLSFAAALLIVLVSSTLGTALALTGAWYDGLFDNILGKALNILFAVPSILIAVIAIAMFGAGFWAPVIALSIVYIPYVAKVIRSAAIQERQRAYVEACQLAGLSSWRINARHILPNLLPIALAQATYGFGSALMDFGAISFIGLGVQPPTAEWGLMVSEGRSELLEGRYQLSLFAGLMIVITVIAFNLLGERLSNRLSTS